VERMVCIPGGMEADAEAGTSDAATEASPNVDAPPDVSSPPDAESYDDPAAPPSPFCCNASPDPCCPSRLCGAPVSAACAQVSSDASRE
jgi:hypothetical protein